MTTAVLTPPAAAVPVTDPATLADVYRPHDYEGERVPHMAQGLANLFGTLESYAWIHRSLSQSGENEAAKTLLAECEPLCEELARKLAAGFAALYPDLEPLIPEAAPKDFTPAVKTIGQRSEVRGQKSEEGTTVTTPANAPAPKTGKKTDETIRSEEGEHTEERTEVESEEGQKALKDAADFLDEHQHHPGIADDKTCKSAVMYHAKSLRGMVKDLEEKPEEEQKDEDMSEEEKSLAKSLITSMAAQAEENERLIKTLAG